MPEAATTALIEGQLLQAERELLVQAITKAAKKPQITIEVGTWLGGGSTLHILRALEENGAGHLWGVESEKSVYDRMLANIRAAAPRESKRFTPLLGRSDEVIPKWLAELPRGSDVDFVFLDGGDNPMEQITEFKLLHPLIPVGGQLMSHDARVRKGKWFVPYISRLDNWQCRVIDASEYGLLHAVKIAPQPSPQSLAAAKRHLLKQRLSPIELAGAILPKQVNAFILQCLPRRLFRYLFRGNK
jgi:predicted O-methyltransferase YrrM